MTGPAPAGPARRAVLFDLDGTLLDTIEDIAASMNAVLERRRLRTYGVEDYKTLVGDGIEVMIGRALAGAPLGPAEMAEIVREYRREYDARWREHSRPYPGIPDLLAALRGRGARTAVLSNKSHPFTAAMTRALLPFPFDAIYGAREGVPLKPDPAAALAIASELRLRPDEFVYLGDTSVDMETAVAAGMFPAGALWGFRSADELHASGARALLAHPLDLLPLLD